MSDSRSTQPPRYNRGFRAYERRADRLSGKSGVEKPRGLKPAAQERERGLLQRQRTERVLFVP